MLRTDRDLHTLSQYVTCWSILVLWEEMLDAEGRGD
jgi:hypothetical protein